MLSFLLRRIASTVPVLVIVALIVFLMLRLAPGDPAAQIVGDSASSADIERVRAQLGLDAVAAGAVRQLVGRAAAGRSRRIVLPQAERRAPDRTAPRADAVAGRADPGDDGADRRAARRPRRLAPRRLARSRADGLLGARLLDPVLRHRLSADLAGLAQARLAAGAGLFAPRRRAVAVARAPAAAGDHAVDHLRRADRARHPRRGARGAGRGLHPHRARQGRAASCACWCAMRWPTPRCRSSP